MPTDNEEALKAYQKDSRIACQYGKKCYQKNPAHHIKYKHSPANHQMKVTKRNSTRGTKRKIGSDDVSQSNIPDSKHKENDSSSSSISSDDERADNSNIIEESSDDDFESPSGDAEASEELKKQNINNQNFGDGKASIKNSDISSSEFADEKKLITELFLVEMPEDFYEFHKLCVLLSPKDPSSALKSVNLELVGPFDVLTGKIKKSSINDKEKYLRHWRYFYDPPEFQTILKGNEKDGLHYGYWRDDVNGKPAFIGKNLACQDCRITKVGPNIFSAVLSHTEEALKKAPPFEKLKILKISQKIKSIAKERNISLDQSSADIKLREKNVVAKTFHGAGIVVKYDKKTQLGYRNLAVTESQFLKILKKIDEASSDKERNDNMSTIEEIVRLATIAADECDFGTPLELGQDLFSSGIDSLQQTALRMLVMSYSLLERPQFSKIAEAHLKDRKKGSSLSVLT